MFSLNARDGIYGETGSCMYRGAVSRRYWDVSERTLYVIRLEMGNQCRDRSKGYYAPEDSFWSQHAQQHSGSVKDQR